MSKINYNDIFEYRDGRLLWKVRRSSNARIGDEAGHIYCDIWGKRYRRVKINGKLIRVHRIIYEMFKGSIPAKIQIDHKDGDGTNNRIENLRLATNSENGKNRKIHRNNTSGLKGVFWYKNRSKWRSTIQVDGKRVHLGYFSTKEEAHNAYCIAARELHKDFHRVA